MITSIGARLDVIHGRIDDKYTPIRNIGKPLNQPPRKLRRKGWLIPVPSNVW